jgi:L-erythro-3,5-diaminohexanoate dehydrogenase
MADITINCVNIPNTEMGSILATKETGLIYFFSMATSFTKAALGAEGIGSDAVMLIGNGYTKDHAEISLNLLRESPALMDVFVSLYG